MDPDRALAEVPKGALLDDSFERSSVAMATCGLDGKLTRINPAFAAMLHYTPEELAGAPWIAITHPADRKGDAAAMADLRAGRATVVEREKRFLRRDGYVIPGRVRVVPLGDPETASCLAVVQPTPDSPGGLWTGPRYQRWMTQTLDPAALLDLDSRLLAVNDALCALFGRQRPALIGRALWEFLREDEAEPWQAAMRLLPEAGMLRRNVRLERPDGGWAAIEASLTDVGDYLAQLVLHDVSQWRELLRRANRPGDAEAGAQPSLPGAAGAA